MKRLLIAIIIVLAWLYHDARRRAAHYEFEAVRLAMAAQNLVEAVRRGEGAAAVRAWGQHREGENL